MFEIRGLGKIERFRWADLVEGMIWVDGIRLNDTVPPELRDYPVLSAALLRRLRDTYRLRPDREVLAIPVQEGHDSHRAAEGLRRTVRRLEQLEDLRRAYRDTLTGLPGGAGTPALGRVVVEQGSLITGVLNSSEAGEGVERATPSSLLLYPEIRLTIADLLARRSRLRPPADSEVVLHLVVDASRGMLGREEHARRAVDLFTTGLAPLCARTRIRLYALSETCRPVAVLPTGRQAALGVAGHATFIKKVLHHRDLDRRNAVLLLASGSVAVGEDAMALGALFRKNRVDYLQVVLGAAQATSWSRFARACGGNQAILTLDAALPAVALEMYDHYLGRLTPGSPVSSAAPVPNPPPDSQPKDAPDTRVRKAVFPRVTRPRRGEG